MRWATVRAASLRGWVCPMVPRMPRPSSRQIFGSWVVLPDPVWPATMTTWCSEMALAISSRRSLTGRSGYVIAGTAASRVATSASATANCSAMCWSFSDPALPRRFLRRRLSRAASRIVRPSRRFRSSRNSRSLSLDGSDTPARLDLVGRPVVEHLREGFERRRRCTVGRLEVDAQREAEVGDAVDHPLVQVDHQLPLLRGLGFRQPPDERLFVGDSGVAGVLDQPVDQTDARLDPRDEAERQQYLGAMVA